MEMGTSEFGCPMEGLEIGLERETLFLVPYFQPSTCTALCRLSAFGLRIIRFYILYIVHDLLHPVSSSPVAMLQVRPVKLSFHLQVPQIKPPRYDKIKSLYVCLNPARM